MWVATPFTTLVAGRAQIAERSGCPGACDLLTEPRVDVGRIGTPGTAAHTP